MDDELRRAKLAVKLAEAESQLRDAKEAQRRTNDPKTAEKKRQTANKVAALRNELKTL